MGLFLAKQFTGGPAPVRPDRLPEFGRVRRGVYAESAKLDIEDRELRYLQRIGAAHLMRPSAVFARESALAAHEIPFGLEPALIYTAGGARTARRKAGVSHSTVELDERDRTEVGGLPVCTIAYALADVARRAASVDAVAAVDHVLRTSDVTKEHIIDALGRQSKRGRAKAMWAIGFADGRAESVGESWSRVRIFELGFAAPELQTWVTGPTGKEWRVDMRFERPGRRPVYGEFDGLQKYGQLANEQGKSGVQALEREKGRDDELLFTGDPAHWVWADVLKPARLEKILLGYGVPRVREPLATAHRTR